MLHIPFSVENSFFNARGILETDGVVQTHSTFLKLTVARRYLYRRIFRPIFRIERLLKSPNSSILTQEILERALFVFSCSTTGWISICLNVNGLWQGKSRYYKTQSQRFSYVFIERLTFWITTSIIDCWLLRKRSVSEMKHLEKYKMLSSHWLPLLFSSTTYLLVKFYSKNTYHLPLYQEQLITSKAKPEI